VDSSAPVEAEKPKKKKIQIEEVDSSAPVEAEKPKKKKIQIEEVDSSAPVEAEKPKKKKIQIEEVDSSAPGDAALALRFKDQGNTAFKAKKFAEAEGFYTKGLNADPSNTALYSNRAVVRLQMQDDAGAEADCTAALEAGIPESSQMKVLYRRAMARNRMKANEDAEKDCLAAMCLSPDNKDCEKLLQEIRAALKEAPVKAKKKKIQIEEVDSSAPVEVEKPKKKKIQIEEVDSSAPAEEVAKPVKSKKKIQIEEVDSSAAGSTLPSSVNYLKSKAAAMASAANFDAAIETYEQALGQLSDLESAPAEEVVAMHMAAAKCSKQVQNYPGTVRHCTAALALNEEDAAVLTLRAQAYESMDKAEKAMLDYTAARGLAPWDKVASDGMNRMRALAKAATMREEQVVKDEAEQAKNQGNTLLKQGKAEQAIEAYTKAIELDPSNHAYFNNRAAAGLKLENFSAALADCDAVLKMAGTKDLATDQRVKCMYRKGLSLAGLGKHGAACDVFREALGLEANNVNVKKALEASEAVVRSALSKEAAKPVSAKKKIQIEEIDSSAPAEEAAKPVKAKKKIQIEEVDSSEPAELVRDGKNRMTVKPKKKIQIEEVDSSAPVEAEKPKKVKKKIQIEEVDSSVPVVEAEKPKKAKKKIQIEEVDSSVPVEAEKPKKVKKKIQIEEVDSSVPVEAEKPKKVKKKIQIEEVDSSVPVVEAAKPVKAKKKIQIEEEDSSLSISTDSGANSSAPKSPPKSPPASTGVRTLPAAFKKKASIPKTGYEFERCLQGCKTPEAAASYMSLLKPSSVPKLLRQNLTPEMLMSIVGGVESGLSGGDAAGLQWLLHLPKVNRFDIIVEFLDDKEKAQVRKAVAKVSAEATVDQASLVKSEYKL